MGWKGFKDIRATIEIDLTPPLADIWTSLDKDARWGVNKARKEGLSVVEANHEESVEFYKIYKSTCQKEKIKQLTFEEYSSGQINGFPSTIFLAKKGEKIAAGIVIVEDSQNKKIGLYINSSVPEFLPFQPNNLLYWHMIEYAKNKDMKAIDLGGYQLAAKKGSKPYEVNRFKMRWAGKIVEYPVYSRNLFYILGRKIIRRFPGLRK